MVEGRARPRRAGPDLMAMRRAGSLCGMTKSHESDPPKALTADWLEANREAISASNAWVKANGLPLRDFRLF